MPWFFSVEIIWTRFPVPIRPLQPVLIMHSLHTCIAHCISELSLVTSIAPPGSRWVLRRPELPKVQVSWTSDYILFSSLLTMLLYAKHYFKVCSAVSFPFGDQTWSKQSSLLRNTYIYCFVRWRPHHVFFVNILTTTTKRWVKLDLIWIQ